ncbi:hypothetical protein ACTXG5_25485 [Mycobacterium sp. Dal123C01]|uniref:hypothetical protein n=1 Tax=Mycobacterium sp. Dal123C01 TaxID=3457577 RepID=UPI00403E9CDA
MSKKPVGGQSSASMPRYAGLAAAGALLAAVITSLVLLLTKQMPSGAVISVAASSFSAFLAACVTFYFSSLHSASSQKVERRWDELLTVVAGIESAAAKATGTEGRPGTITQLMAGLEARGLWDANDTAEFRKTLRLRNDFVHGGQRPIESDAELTEAVESARRLLNKVEAVQTTE